jgi:hypothetical protein
MTEKKVFYLVNLAVLARVMEFCRLVLGEGWKITLEPKKRTDDQNRRFHWLCGLLAKSQLTFAGKRRTLAQWKVLLVSGHAVATNEGHEILPGIEGEFVNLRESTAQMSVRRSTSLIEYTQAFMAQNSIDVPAFDEEFA